MNCSPPVYCPLNDLRSFQDWFFFFLHNNKVVRGPWYWGQSILLLEVPSVCTEQVAWCTSVLCIVSSGNGVLIPNVRLNWFPLRIPAVPCSVIRCCVWDFCHRSVFIHMGKTAMKMFCPLQNPADVWRQVITKLSAKLWNLGVCSREPRALKGAGGMLSSWFHWAWLLFHELISKLTSFCV